MLGLIGRRLEMSSETGPTTCADCPTISPSGTVVPGNSDGEGGRRRALYRFVIGPRKGRPGERTAADSVDATAAHNLLIDFGQKIAAVRVVDPACGSGNLLYVSLKQMLDLWMEVWSVKPKHTQAMGYAFNWLYLAAVTTSRSARA